MLYKLLFPKIAMRLGEAGIIKGTTAAAVEAFYNDPAFGAAHVDNPAFPFSAMKDAVLFAEEKIVQTVSAVKMHPLRAFILGVTNDLANFSTMPTADSGGNKIFGVHGAIYKGNVILTEVENPQEIHRLNRLKTNVLKKSYYKFAWDGSKLVHTCDNVKMEVCKWNRATQAALLPAGEMLFPDVMEETYVCGAVAYQFRNGEAPENTKQYLTYFFDSLRTIGGGNLPQNADFS